MGFHLSFLIAVMGTSHDGIRADSTLLSVWYPFVIYLIGFVVFSVMQSNRKALFFYVLLSVISLTLVLPLSKLTVYMLSLWPLLICNFCFEFFQMNTNRLRPIVTNIVGLVTAMFIFTQLFLDRSMQLLLLLPQMTLGWIAHLATVSLLFFALCSFLISFLPDNSVTGKDTSKQFRQLFLMSICSYAILYTLNTLTEQALFQSLHTIYTFILLPIVFAYILLQDESVYVYYNRREMALLALLTIFIFSLNILFLRYILYLPDEEIVLIFLLFIFTVYFTRCATGMLSADKVDNMNESLYENRKIEFLYQIRFQKLLHDYVVFVLHELQRNGYANSFICLKTNGKMELFDEKNSVGISDVTNYFERIIATGCGEFELNGKTYWIFSLLSRHKANGFIAVQTTDILRSTVAEMVDGYVVLLQQLYDLASLQQHYKSLPVIRLPDFVVKKYQYEIRRVQEDESQYLHDVVLQKMFTIKNFLELMDVRNARSKEYVLLEMKELSAALISHMYDLYPFTLKTLSLYEVLLELITRLKNTKAYRRHEPDVELIMNKGIDIPRYFFYPIYSFVKGLLSYIFTASEATSIVIYLSVQHDQIMIKVIDNGRRVQRRDEEDVEYNKRNEILTINYEVKELGGKISTTFNYPVGSTIVIQLPYKEEVNRWR